VAFFIDLTLLALCVVGITALMGTISHVIAVKLFGGNRVSHFVMKSKSFQQNWSPVKRKS
jgi:arginine exporter protein ArgO